MIHNDAMAIIFSIPITFNAGEVFRFGSLSCIADKEGVLHSIAEPSEKRSPPMAPIVEAGSPHLTSVKTTPTNFKVRRPQPTSASRKSAPASGGPRTIATPMAQPAEGAPLSRRTPLSTSPTRVWTRITRRKGVNGLGTGVAAVLATLAVAGLDRGLFGDLGWLFGVGYLVVCFQLAVRVRYADLLAAPISGPIGFALALVLLAPVSSPGITAQLVALATGLALRAGWLFSGTGLAAVIVLARFVAQRRIHRSR